MPVQITTRLLPSSPVRAVEVRRRAENMLRALGMPEAELSILLCPDTVIRELNRDYRGLDRPTDVLAFAMQEGQGAAPPTLLGDVVISMETARRQANERGRPIVDEVTFLLAHGLLHLLGYDHQTDAEERRMSARTDMLCAAAKPPKSGSQNRS